MEKVFSNAGALKCVFNDEGITFYDQQQEVRFPYGCIDSLKISFLGVLQVTCHPQVCSFAVDHKDRAAVKDMMKFAREQMKTAPKADVQIIDLRKKAGDDIPDNLSTEENLKRYKSMFIQGTISKEEYEARKRQLTDK